jgi:hypothetical protein
MSDLVSKRTLGAAMAELARTVPKAPPSATTAAPSGVSRIGAAFFPDHACTVPRTLAKNRQHNLRNSDRVHRVFDPAGRFDAPPGSYPDIVSDAESLVVRVPKRKDPHGVDLTRQVRRGPATRHVNRAQSMLEQIMKQVGPDPMQLYLEALAGKR